MTTPALVVMAAGIGSRYGGLKQLDPAGPSGESIIEYSVFDALRAGFGRVVILLRRELEAPFREQIGRRIEERADVVYAFQELSDLPAGFTVPAGRVKPWGTAHAILCCRDVVTTPFAVINADDFYGAEAFRLLAAHLRGARETGGIIDAVMVGYRLARTLSEFGPVARGVCEVSAGGALLGIRERTRIERWGDDARCSDDGVTWERLAGDAIASLNTWGFTTGLFAELERRFPRFLERAAGRSDAAEFFLPEVVSELIAEERARVGVVTTPDRWYGITYRDDLPHLQGAVEAMVRSGAYPRDLWSDTAALSGPAR